MGVPGYNEPPFKYANITTNTTTVVKTGPGVLHTITVNIVGTAPATLTIFDNTAGSGTKIATATITASDTWFLYDVGFNNGLTIVTASGATVGDYTVSYL